MNKISRKICKIAKNNQKLFRSELKKRDKHCLLTKVDPVICEAAHIVEVKDTEKYPFLDLYNPNNGLLLRSDIHKSFDCNYLTMDIRKKKIRYNDTHMFLNLIYTNSIHISDNIYTTIKVPVECYPYLCYRYYGEYNI